MTNEQRISVSINFGEKGTVYGCGHALDTMLYAYGLTTEEETWEWNADAEREAIEYVLREYDWEAYTLERFNEMSPGIASEWLRSNFDAIAIIGSIGVKIVQSEYLPGDWLRIDFPAAFKKMVSADKEAITELVNDTPGDWTNEKIPADLRKELTRAYESAQEDNEREWLHGDRSSDGVLRKLVQALFGRYTAADIDWDPKTDTVTIDTTPDEWREWMGYDLADGEPLPDPKTLGENMRDVTLYKAQGVKEKQRIANESRQQERARLEERKRLQEEEEKEAARQRKLKKIQAS